MKHCVWIKGIGKYSVCARCGDSFIISQFPAYRICSSPEELGWGDLLSIALKYVGFSWVFKKLNPRCGCDERKESLNAFGVRLVYWFRQRRLRRYSKQIRNKKRRLGISQHGNRRVRRRERRRPL